MIVTQLCDSQVVTRFWSACLLTIVHVAPFTLSQPFLRKPPSTRETGFTRGAGQLRDFFLRQRYAYCCFVRLLRRKLQRVFRPLQNELGEFFRDRIGETQRTDLSVST